MKKSNKNQTVSYAFYFHKKHLIMFFLVVGALLNSFSGYSTNKKNDSLPTIRLKAVDSSSWHDETVLYFEPNATIGFNPKYDGDKLYNTDPQIANLYIYVEKIKYAIKALPQISEGLIVPLGFEGIIEGTYTFVSSLKNMQKHRVYLHDYLMDTKVELHSTPEYTFTATDDYINRFALEFRMISTNINEDVNTSNKLLWKTPNHMYVSTDKNCTIGIYDSMGRIVSSKNIKKGTATINMSDIAPGMYFIKSSNGESRKIIKK